MRLIVIRTLLGQLEHTTTDREAADVLRLDPNQAANYLDADVIAFSDGAKQMREIR